MLFADNASAPRLSSPAPFQGDLLFSQTLGPYYESSFKSYHASLAPATKSPPAPPLRPGPFSVFAAPISWSRHFLDLHNKILAGFAGAPPHLKNPQYDSLRYLAL